MQRDTTKLLKSNGFIVQTETKYEGFSVKSVELSVKKRNVNHSFYLGILKYVFVAATVLTLFLYFRIVRTLLIY